MEGSLYDEVWTIRRDGFSLLSGSGGQLRLYVVGLHVDTSLLLGAPCEWQLFLGITRKRRRSLRICS